MIFNPRNTHKIQNSQIFFTLKKKATIQIGTCAYCICSLFNYGDIGDNIHYNKALYKSLIIECLVI